MCTRPNFGCSGHRLLLLLITLAFVPAVGAALPSSLFGEDTPSLAPMLEDVLPSVVNISTSSTVRRANPLLEDPFFRKFFDLPYPRRQQRRAQSLGSGVVIDSDRGLVVTNAHVIDQADEITVTLQDGRNLSATVIGADPDSDVAVIKIPGENLSEIRVGDSTRLRVGDFVVAIGNPFGLNQTVTSGIVSALGRSGLGIEGYEDFIQTDASINPGNSGGALVNLRGELVGINTAILAPSGGNVGIGFAIPINMVQQLTDQLVKHGRVQRGRLGVYIQDLTPALVQAFGIQRRKGALIAQVVPGSAAAAAGVREGDVVVAVNDRRIDDGADLRNAIGLFRVGQEIELQVVRNDREHRLHARIDQAPLQQVAGERLHPRLEGAVFSAWPNHGSGKSGVWVRAVTGASPAWNSGLRADDVIIAVNRRLVQGIEQFTLVASRADTLLLNLQRNGGAYALAIR